MQFVNHKSWKLIRWQTECEAWICATAVVGLESVSAKFSAIEWVTCKSRTNRRALGFHGWSSENLSEACILSSIIKTKTCFVRELLNLAGFLPHGTKVLILKTTHACVHTAGTTWTRTYFAWNLCHCSGGSYCCGSSNTKDRSDFFNFVIWPGTNINKLVFSITIPCCCCFVLNLWQDLGAAAASWPHEPQRDLKEGGRTGSDREPSYCWTGEHGCCSSTCFTKTECP